jgi:hypothetical protein
MVDARHSIEETTMDMKQHTKNKPQRRDDANAFIPESSLRTGTGDELAQQLAEGHQRAVTTGEDDAEDARDALQTEEIGGPFLVSGPEEEFGQEAFTGHGKLQV